MICPYACNLEEVTQSTFDYDEEGRQSMHQIKVVQKRIYVPCAEEDCGMWRDGGCARRND